MASADRCLFCGEIIPEGRHICKDCEESLTPGIGKKITCDICPRCRDNYPNSTDGEGNHFCICGMSGNMVYTQPRKVKRYSGPGYLHFGISSCGLYDSIEDALEHMTESEIKRWRESKNGQG